MSDETTTPTTPLQTPAPIRPHVRAGSIASGAIVVAVAALVLWVTSEPSRREAVTDWALTLTPGGAALVGVLVLGGFLLLGGVLAAIRRAQRKS